MPTNGDCHKREDATRHGTSEPAREGETSRGEVAWDVLRHVVNERTKHRMCVTCQHVCKATKEGESGRRLHAVII